MSLGIRCILILAASTTGFALQADVIYTNFGTGNDGFSAGAGVIVTNDNSAWSSVAIAFTPSANYNLTSIELVATDVIPDDSGATIGIFADNGGQPGGAPVESFALGPLGQFGEAALVLTVTSLLQPLLLANTRYWIGLNAPTDGFIVWNQSVTSALGFSQSEGAGDWSTSNADQGVVEIDGTLAPDTPPALTRTDDSITDVREPHAWWLMAGGLAAVARFTQRTRLANQK